MTRKEIKENLFKGDQTKVAKKHNTSLDYVNKILSSEKRGQRGKGKEILNELVSVANSNIEFFRQKV